MRNEVTKIKICGLTRPEEVIWVLEEQVDYLGMVLFFPKSKRNNSMENAEKLLGVYREACERIRQEKQPEWNAPKTVAVTVSPTPEQIGAIEETGFDMIQIHGVLSKEAFDAIHLPIIRAFNVTDMVLYEKFHACPKVAAYLFDAHIPGSGQTFDWKLLDNIPRDEKPFFLAGGLNSENVREAIKKVHPDVVDVSSGVEVVLEGGAEPEKSRTGDRQAACMVKESGNGIINIVGKDKEKIKEFVRKVRTDE